MLLSLLRAEERSIIDLIVIKSLRAVIIVSSYVQNHLKIPF